MIYIGSNNIKQLLGIPSLFTFSRLFKLAKTSIIPVFSNRGESSGITLIAKTSYRGKAIIL
jgi:hypothetical protein